VTNDERSRGRRIQSALRGGGEFLFILPAIGLVSLLVLGPASVALVRSLYLWNPGYTSTFVGLDNFRQLADSPIFREILRNEGVFLLGVPIWTLAPLAVALFLYERVALVGLVRSILLFPAVLSPAIVGILFRSVLAPDGTLNSTLKAVGLGSLARQWIDSPSLVKPVLIVVLTWAGMGVGVLIFSAALTGVSPELFEAAEIDGASWLQRFRFIAIPALMPVIVFYVVFQTVSVFLYLFGWIYVLTQGGPGFSSTTLDYDTYQNGIVYGRFGLAAAESVYLLIIVALVLGAGSVAARLLRRRAASA
jgi:ABC-type sugar transport system permease subunit